MTIEEQYLKLVCDELKVSPEDARSKCRKRELSEARMITSYVMKKHLKKSLWGIARFFNYVSHQSVLWNIYQVNILMEGNTDFRQKAEPVLRKASQFARDIERFRKEERKQVEYDKIFAALKEEDWYNTVYYAESLMLPI